MTHQQNCKGVPLTAVYIEYPSTRLVSNTHFSVDRIWVSRSMFGLRQHSCTRELSQKASLIFGVPALVCRCLHSVPTITHTYNILYMLGSAVYTYYISQLTIVQYITTTVAYLLLIILYLQNDAICMHYKYTLHCPKELFMYCTCTQSMHSASGYCCIM